MDFFFFFMCNFNSAIPSGALKDESYVNLEKQDELKF